MLIDSSLSRRRGSNVKGDMYRIINAFTLRDKCYQTTSHAIAMQTLNVNKPLRFIYIRAKAKVKAIFFFDLCCCCCRCSTNTQIGNNATDWKRHRFRSNINEPKL